MDIVILLYLSNFPHLHIRHTKFIGYSDNGYSDILDIVILLSLSNFPHLHIRHTKFIGYSDIMVIVIIWP